MKKGAYDLSVRAAWGDLRRVDQRSFLALIADPDEDGCSAWHGQMVAGVPEWSRLDGAARTLIRGQARRILAQSQGVDLSPLDQVVVSCGNPGCMSWGHMSVKRQNGQRITEDEKRAALEKHSASTHECPDHPGASFRVCFVRQKSGVKAFFKCTQCELRRRQEKNRAGRRFKDARRGF